MIQVNKIRPWYFLASVCCALALGFAIAWVAKDQRQAKSEASWPGPLLLRADTASGGKSVSMATAMVDGDYECLFLLDHLTGNLYCTIINPRTGLEAAVFQNNVLTLIGQDRVGDPDFTMVTGGINLDMAGRVGNMRTAPLMCYVAEGNSGAIIGFSFSFNPQAVLNGVRQEGLLNPIWQTTFRAPQLRRN